MTYIKPFCLYPIINDDDHLRLFVSCLNEGICYLTRVQVLKLIVPHHYQLEHDLFSKSKYSYI